MSNFNMHLRTALNSRLWIAAACFYLGFATIMPVANAQKKSLEKPLPNAFVCPSPAAPCSPPSYEFASYDLSFNLPNQLKWQSAHNSNHFFAVILKSSKAIHPDPSDPNDNTECGGYFSEEERSSVQAMFPSRKVFASRHGCSMVWYNNVNTQYNFLAVYAGQTLGEAKNVLNKVKATGRFTDANIREMQIVVDNGH